MKISPKNYAQALIQSVKTGKPKQIAPLFWHKLQKNGQYKDLKQILELLDLESARNQGKTLVKIYSEKALSPAEISQIEARLTSLLKKEIITKQIIKKNLTGIIVKADDIEINLSLEGKIDKLQQILNK